MKRGNRFIVSIEVCFVEFLGKEVEKLDIFGVSNGVVEVGLVRESFVNLR